ncbi:hypothetical protein [Methylobacillus sp.]|uniref:hypothetical protein n=1 Tax=Methylobacillus sp. TaxID=56818 RepID=UPI002FE3D8EB
MKKLLLLLIFPVTAMANPFMGDCKSQYNDAYQVMMVRQSGVPMHVFVDVIEKQEPREEDQVVTSANVADFLEAKRESIKIIERAYTMPNFGFMESAAHTMAVEFANHQYMRCTRANRK